MAPFRQLSKRLVVRVGGAGGAGAGGARIPVEAVREVAGRTDVVWRRVYNSVLRRALRDRLTAQPLHPVALERPYAAASAVDDAWVQRALLAALATYEVDTWHPCEQARMAEARAFLERVAGAGVRPLRAVGRAPAPTLVVETAPGTVQVASRGTFSVLDLYEDFRARLVPAAEADGLGACRVHEGFLGAFRVQAAEVLPSLPDDGLVVFQGHSLGAVVAQMLAVAYARRRRGREPGYRAPLLTFGCPRGGDDAYQRAVGEMTEHARVWLEADPIASLPCPDMRLARERFFGGEYAPHAADAHIRLSLTGPARLVDGPGAGAQPDAPPTLPVALARFARYHTQNSYAGAMLAHMADERERARR